MPLSLDKDSENQLPSIDNNRFLSCSMWLLLIQMLEWVERIEGVVETGTSRSAAVRRQDPYEPVHYVDSGDFGPGSLVLRWEHSVGTVAGGEVKNLTYKQLIVALSSRHSRRESCMLQTFSSQIFTEDSSILALTALDIFGPFAI